jgi:hypothetical protein
MSNLIRSSLSEGLAADVATSLTILIAWTVLGWAVLARVVGKRG